MHTHAFAQTLEQGSWLEDLGPSFQDRLIVGSFYGVEWHMAPDPSWAYAVLIRHQIDCVPNCIYPSITPPLYIFSIQKCCILLLFGHDSRLIVYVWDICEGYGCSQRGWSILREPDTTVNGLSWSPGLCNRNLSIECRCGNILPSQESCLQEYGR